MKRYHALDDFRGTTGERLHGLDALRGIAAILVLLHHCDILIPARLGFDRGYLAVDFFFILSGFVMARTFEDRFRGGLGPYTFVRARIRRFWPMMAVGTTFGLLVYLSIWDPVLLAAAYVLGLLIVPMPGQSPFVLNGPTWSLFDEFVANAVHAAFGHRLRVPALLAIVGTGFAILAASGGRFGTMWFGIPRVMVGYPLGIVLWRLNGDKTRAPWWCAAAALVLSVIAADVSNLGYWFDFVAVAIAAFAVVGGLARPPIPVPLAAGLGALSFPLYALHNPIVYGVHRAGFGLTAMLSAALGVTTVAMLVSSEFRGTDRTLRLPT